MVGRSFLTPEISMWKWKSLCCVQFFVILWSVARHAPLSMDFSRQEYWSGFLLPTLGDFPNPEIEPTSLLSLALAGVLFTTSTIWEAHTSPTHTLGQFTTIFAQELCSGGREMHLSYLWRAFSRTADWMCQIWKKDTESLCGCLFSFLDIEYSMITW